MGKLRNRKATGKVTGEMMIDEGNQVMNWIWRLCNITFESGDTPEDWRSAVIVPLYKGKGERTESSNYRGVSLLNMVGKIYTGILVDRLCEVTEGFIDDMQRELKKGGGEKRRSSS